VGDGTTFRDRLLANPNPSVCDIVEACSHLGETLRKLADKGVFHRDIKPQNIAFRTTDSWKPVLIDFGIARADDATTITTTGKLIGSPYYSPPEWRLLPVEPVAVIDANAWDCYSYARTSAIAIGVSLGRSLMDLEWLPDRDLLAFIRRHLPDTAAELKPGLSKDPKARPDLKNIGTGYGSIELDLTVSDDLGTQANEHITTIRTAIEGRLQFQVRHRAKFDKYGALAVCIYPKGLPEGPRLILGSSFYYGVPCLRLRGNALTGRAPAQRGVPARFVRWAREHHAKFAALDVGLKRGDRIRKVITRALNWARRHPSEDMHISWELWGLERARAYEKLSTGNTEDIDPLLELWRILISSERS
jgi:hypothetical protein